jgi:uncharacterized protein (TIGR03118 family)
VTRKSALRQRFIPAPGRHTRARWLALPLAVAAVGAGLPIAASLGQTPNQYTQTNLISDIPGVARITDPNLVNPWGQSEIGGSPLWVADNNSKVSTLYTGGVNGSTPSIVPLVVKIVGGTGTGTVGNTTGSTTDFLVHTPRGTAPANFIFDSESGNVTAWSGRVSGKVATNEFRGGSAAVYKGLALASVGTDNFLYATNFRARRIDVFDGSFHRMKFPSGPFGAGAFRDPGLPPSFAPFGIQLINGELYVSYAKQNAQKHDDVAGPGNGFVDVFDTDGVLKTRLISRGALNSPWGLVLAPSTFGGFGGDLLVGNFGDGTIHAYDPATGAPQGTVSNTDGNPIAIDGLWALRFGNGTFGGPNDLVFTAGIVGESHGLLGEITPAG